MTPSAAGLSVAAVNLVSMLVMVVTDKRTDIAILRTEAQAYRYGNMRRLVSWLVSNGPLRAGLTEEEAAAIVWTMASPEVHGLLRVVRGWSAERYREWLRESLTRILLP